MISSKSIETGPERSLTEVGSDVCAAVRRPPGSPQVTLSIGGRPVAVIVLLDAVTAEQEAAPAPVARYQARHGTQAQEAAGAPGHAQGASA